MNIGGRWLFGRPDEIYIENDILWRRVYETEQTYHIEMVITKKEFELCMKEWGNKNE